MLTSVGQDTVGFIGLIFIVIFIGCPLSLLIMKYFEKRVSSSTDDIKILEPELIVDPLFAPYTTINIKYNVISYDLLLYCAVRDPRYREIQNIGIPITLKKGKGIINIGNFKSYEIDNYVKNSCQFVVFLAMLNGKTMKEREESFYTLFNKKINVKRI